MLNKHLLSILSLVCATSVYANIPIELHGLSQNTHTKSDATAATSSNLNWQLVQKNQQLENDLRILRGQLEEQDHQMSDLKSDFKNRYVDLDQRLNLLLQKVDPDAVIEPSFPEDNLETQSIDDAVQLPVISSMSNPVLSGTASNVSNPSISSNVSNLNAAQQTQPAEQDKLAYSMVLDIFKQSGAKASIEPMQNFIVKYPNSIYVANAYYGLAEFYLADPSNYTEAKKYFDYLVNNYPQSPRVPRALNRLYYLAKNSQQNMLLAEQYKSRLLSQYPNSDDANAVQNNP